MATNNGTGGPYDYGREIGDEQLREMQDRLSRLYTQAGEDVTRRLDAFLQQFDAKDQLMREQVADGLISEDEYLLWRQNKILRATQMNAQMNSLANDLVNVDKIAVEMINGQAPDVYCAAYNFEGFRGETMAQMEGYNYNTFSMYNADAVRIITTEDPDLIPWKEPAVDIPKDLRWNRRHIQDAITQGIMAGDDMRQLSRRLLPLVNMDETAAMRTARTSYIGIQNQARRDATARIREAGIPMEETWVSVLQANTRDTHLMLHGTHPNEEGLFGEGILPRGHLLRFPGDPNGQPEQIYNCQCGVTSRIAGIDHSDQADRYERFMTENYYDDWVGHKVDSQGEEFYVTGARDYRLEETREALERRRRLMNGEIQPRGLRGASEYAAPAAPAAPAPINMRDSDLSRNLRARLSPIAYERLDNPLTDSEIIAKVGGADKTEGSCVSLAYTYCANRAGYDVTDFRGGSSLSGVATWRATRNIGEFDGVVMHYVEGQNDFKMVDGLLKLVEPNKEYVLITAHHGAVIRMAQDGGFQYLELQSAANNGWHPLTESTLRRRFRCSRQHTHYGRRVDYPVALFDADSLENSEEFAGILPYINTNNPLRGAGGYAK